MHAESTNIVELRVHNCFEPSMFALVTRTLVMIIGTDQACRCAAGGRGRIDTQSSTFCFPLGSHPADARPRS